MDPITINNIKNSILSNLCFTIATVDPNGKPSATPLFFASDENFKNFYWVSAHDSHHSTNIETNPSISVVAFNSSANHGIYMSGSAKMLTDLDKIKNADDLMKSKLKIKDGRQPEYYCAPNPRRMYEFTYDKIWINIRTFCQNQLVDERFEEINTI